MQKSFLTIIMLLSLKALAISEVDTTFIASDGLEIGGTLGLPDSISRQKRPAILFLHGSGPLDRDLQIPGSITADGKPSFIFKTLAHEISENGFITFRYDKRGVTKNENSPASIDNKIYATGNVKQLVKDALSAIEFLKAHPNVDSRRIILLGLSEGTILAPMIAKQAPETVGLILMSAAGQNLKDLLYFQQVQRNIDLAKDKIDLNQDGFLVEEEVAQFPNTHFPLDLMDQDGDDKVSLPELKALLLAQHYNSLALVLDSPNKNWYQQHFEIAPNYQTLASFTGPILLLQGEIDAQTPLSDALLIKSHLEITGHTDLTFHSFPNLGHGFSPHIGKKNIIPTVGPLEPHVLVPLVDWLKERF